MASADVEALIQATASVRNAQTGGTQAGELREVMRAQRDALARLLDAAGRVAREAGTSLTLALQRRVQNTVQAAAAGQPQSLKDGLLETELQPSGFEGLLGAEPTRTVRDEKHPLEPDPAADRARKKEAAARAHALQEAQREAGQLGEKAKKLEQHAAALEREAARAREDADEARRKSDEAAALVLELGRLTPRPE